MDKLHELAAQAIEELAAGGKTVATAESCTGGLVSAALTHNPDSSKAFLGGVVAYANSAKCRLLGVSESLIEENGAVCLEVALEMAKGARAATGADFGIGLTGIAGPGGGTAEKPVGLVFVAVAGGDASEVKELRLDGDRTEIRISSAIVALEMLLSIYRQSSIFREIQDGKSSG